MRNLAAKLGYPGILLGALCLQATTFSSFAQVKTSPPAAQVKEGSLKKRLNQLFYWQLADELKLSPEQESQTVGALEALQSQRQALIQDRETILKALEKVSSSKVSAESIQADLLQLKKNSDMLASLDSQEFEELLEILGPEKYAQFLTIRERIAKKVRDAIN